MSEVEREGEMIKRNAIEIISDGHSIIAPYIAKEVCQVFKVPFSAKLIHRWKSDGEGKYALSMNENAENTNGVYTLELSRYIAKQLRVDKKAGIFYGRGSQARAYAKEIEKTIS